MKYELFLKGILEKEVDVSNEIYQKDFEGLTYKVNWDVFGAKGYQIYEQNKYVYKIGENLQDPDATLSFLTKEFLDQLLRKEKLLTRMRISEEGYYLCRYDLFISTRTATKDVNAQILIAKIPFFQWVVPNFGSSRLARPLHSVEPIEIESSKIIEIEEIESLVKKMLSESVDVEDEQYKKDFKDQVLKVNWEIGEISANQVFEESTYNYEFGKLHEDADLTIVIENLNFIQRFLRKDPTNFAPGLDSNDNFVIYVANPIVEMQFKDPNTHSFFLSRFPFMPAIYQQRPISITEQKEVRENFGGYIPVNLPIGDYENVVVPYKVFEHFINKASNIILRTCPCRERGNCQNHAIELGCIFMGDDTLNMAVSEGQSYVATKEQALEHVKMAIADGLTPLIGRNVAEAEGAGVKDTGHFLSCCFCCECCCVVVKAAKYATSALRGSGDFKKIEGLELKLDPVKCIGCGKCVEVCAFNAREIIDGKSTMDPNLCLGCGRCVDACPNGAISIEIDEKYLDEFITRIESIVDVKKQL
ncbi:MAG: 4Fe-4S dicluster domain-containing protein [Promethearchaeota archaeon]